MEEFTNKNDIGVDKDIILPAEKKITLEPIHDNVHVDDESDVQIAAGHANGTPIGNITSDREATAINDTAEPVAPAAATPLATPVKQKTGRRVSYRSVIVMGLIIAALLFALLYR